MLLSWERTNSIESSQQDEQSDLPLLTAEGKPILQTFFVNLSGGNGVTQSIRALIDQGSQSTLITRELVELIQPKLCTSTEFILTGIVGHHSTQIDKRVEVAVGPRNGNPVGLIRAYQIEKICNPIDNFVSNHLHAHLASFGIEVDDCASLSQAKSTPISLLIGADNIGTFLTGDCRRLSDSLMAVHTIAGWTLSGMNERHFGFNRQPQFSLVVSVSNNSVSSVASSKQDTINFWMKQVEETLEFKSGRYWVGLPWLHGSHCANNFQVSLFRLRKLVERLRRSGFYERYEEEIQRLLVNGHAEPIAFSRDDLGYYMPHREVVKSDHSTTKVRIVFDASSHGKDAKSLNAILSKGIDLNPSIFRLLARFRLGQTAFVADIEKAFLQIRVREEDRDFLRFLWIDSNDQLVAYRMTSVPFGATSSPFLLSSVIRRHLLVHIDQFPVANALIDRIYVDDLVMTTPNPVLADDYKNQACRLFDQCGMSLRKWRSSDHNLDRAWNQSANTTNSHPVLGLKWHISIDRLALAKIPTQPKSFTRRQVLSAINSIYDPLGLFTPIHIDLRIKMRQFCSAGLDWDEQLSEDAIKSFQKTFSSLNQLETADFPRRVSDCISGGRLVVFGDGSSKAIGAAAYYSASHGQPFYLLAATARLAPDRTIPEIELCAALLAVELYQRLAPAVRPDFADFFTDSTTVLVWIKAISERSETVFRMNRIRKIRCATSPDAWHHVRTDENPADMASRGMDVSSFICSRLWRSGPSFLHDYQSTPTIQNQQSTCLLAPVQSKVDWSDHEDWIALFERFKTKLEPIAPSTAEIETAIWIDAQSNSFPTELKLLNSRLRVNVDSPLFKFAPFVDRLGLLRVSGRVLMGNESTDHPIVLDARHVSVRSWIKYRHERLGHPGLPTLMSHLREQFLIFKLRSICRSVLARCEHCVRKRSLPIAVPEGMLPIERITPTDAFRCVGMDFAGPFHLRYNSKRWILLITCLSSRAVHLEVVRGLSVADLWQSIWSFIARRGHPSVVFSDNGLSFVRMSEDIRLIMDNLRSISANPELPSIRWKFSSPLSPWQGGVFERMVGLVKNCLYSLTTKLGPSDREFILHLSECEAIINSRPIGLFDDGHVLTPGHLLIGRRPLSWSPIELPENLPRLSTSEMFNRRSQILDHFWKVWKRTYLLSLPGRLQSKGRTADVPIGSIVIISEPGLRRNDWRVGRITDSIVGPDGVTRNYVVNVNGVEYRRAAQSLYLLETDSSTPEVDAIVTETQDVAVRPSADDKEHADKQ